MIDPNRTVGQRRLDPRHKMFSPVALHLGDTQTRAHFLDLSSSGALAHCETPPSAGAYIMVEAAGVQASGRVMWVVGKRFGIRFSQPLTDPAMAVLIEGA